jgi:thiol:disulfide interchange protein DsbA
MDTRRRSLIKTFTLAALAPAVSSIFSPIGTALAQPRPPFTEIKPPLPSESEGKIEVAEFFWYGCIHCYNLEPALEGWLKKVPPDVQFRRVPAVFNARWGHDAAIYYTFESMGVLDKVHRPFFDAIHRDHLQTDSSTALGEWLVKNGIDTKKFNETLKSFGVQSKVRKATQLTVGSKIDGTPAILVQGRYQVGAGERMLDNVNEAIEFARTHK